MRAIDHLPARLLSYGIYKLAPKIEAAFNFAFQFTDTAAFSLLLLIRFQVEQNESRSVAALKLEHN